MREVVKKIIGIENIDRRAEKMVKKSIRLYHCGLIGKIRALRLYKKIRKEYSCDIWPGVEFGENVYIAHPNNILIGKTSHIGNNCKIYPNCQLIASLKNDDYLFENGIRRHPYVGDNAIIGCGSMLIGPITIGNNVTIGAGAIVTKDVPDDSVVINVNQIKKRR